jgi:hypothetical protein
MSALERYYRSRHVKFRQLLGWRDHIANLSDAVKKVLPDAEVYLFGSALEGELTANSDVDVLIVSERASGPQRHKLATMIENELKMPLLFEIHLTTRDRLEWYRKHAKKLTSVELFLKEY